RSRHRDPRGRRHLAGRAPHGLPRGARPRAGLGSPRLRVAPGTQRGWPRLRNTRRDLAPSRPRRPGARAGARAAGLAPAARGAGGSGVMALAELQSALAEVLRGSVAASAGTSHGASGRRLTERERGYVERLRSTRGLAFTAEVRRSWCEM